MPEWYFMRGQERVGPLTQAQVEGLYQRGDIDDSTYVWTAGMANWAQAGQIRDQLSGPAPGSGNLMHDLGLDEPVVKPYTYNPGEGGGYGGGGGGEYAGFWLRWVAMILDGIILGCLIGLPFNIIQVMAMGGMEHFGEPQPLAQSLFWTFAGMILNIIVFAAFEASPWQATPGKKILRIRVTDLDGDRLTFVRAAGRNAGKIVSGVILLIGYIMAAFTEQKQALHDIMAGCLVVRD